MSAHGSLLQESLAAPGHSHPALSQVFPLLLGAALTHPDKDSPVKSLLNTSIPCPA